MGIGNRPMKTFSMEPGKEKLSTIDCPLCGAGDYRPRWESPNYIFVRCRKCGLMYQNPQPAQEDLSGRYDQEYFQYERTNEEQFFHLMTLGLRDIGFESLESSINDPSRSFLDVGCATGSLIAHMTKRNWSVQGVEICKPAAEYGTKNRKVPISIGTLENAAFPDGSFTVAHCSHLIEHLTDPISFIREIRRVLKPGGYFVAATPNSDGFQARLFGNNWRSAIADHVVLYSRRTLRQLLNSNGFHLLRAKTWGGIAIGMAPQFIKRPMDTMAKKLGFGDVMIMLARKTDDDT